MMNPNIHHVAATSLPDSALGASPPPKKEKLITNSVQRWDVIVAVCFLGFIIASLSGYVLIKVAICNYLVV